MMKLSKLYARTLLWPKVKEAYSASFAMYYIYLNEIQNYI